jgi:hypothetical protein
MNDYKILTLYIVFGFFIMIGYMKMITKKGNSEIWSNQKKNIILNYPFIKYIYIIMICISFIVSPYLVYYLTTTSKNQTDEILIYLGSVLFLVCSMVWAFNPFYLPKIFLGTVAIGAILILAGICVNSEADSETKKILALTASSIIVLQTSLFDFSLWTGLI